MRVRILVADQGEAEFYDMRRSDDTPMFAGGMCDPVAHLHDRDLVSDRPGRVFDHAAGPGRRGATAHHGTGGERSPRKHEAGQFAQRIARSLEEDRRAGAFERLVVMAPPAFLGALRAALPDSLRAIVAAEIAKDLVHGPPGELHTHLPREVFVRHVNPSAE